MVFREAYLHVVSQFRIFSRFLLPTTFGAFLGFSFPLVVGKMEKSWAKVLAGLMLLFLLLTKSIGGVLTAGVSSLAYLYLTGRKKAVAVIVLISIIVLSAVVVLRGRTLKESPPWKLRLLHWKRTVQAFSETPIVGTGFRRFHYRALSFSREGEAFSLYTHNAFLQFLAEGGVFALIFALLFLSGIQFRKEMDPAVAAAFLGWLFHCSIDIGFYFPSIAVAGALLARGVFVPKPGRRLVSPVVVFALFAALAFFERGYFTRIKWNYYTGERGASYPAVVERLFYWDDEALLLLYRMEGSPSHLRRAIHIYPYNPVLYYHLALEKLREGQLEDALINLNIALKLQPSNRRAIRLKQEIERKLRDGG